MDGILQSTGLKKKWPGHKNRIQILSGERRMCWIFWLWENRAINQRSWHRRLLSLLMELIDKPICVRCETLQVCDLKGLAASTLNARTMETMKKLIQVNTCFPEASTLCLAVCWISHAIIFCCVFFWLCRFCHVGTELYGHSQCAKILFLLLVSD